MATQLTTRIIPGTGATVKGDLLTNEEIDNNFLSLNDNKLESENNLSDLTDLVAARTNLDVPKNDGTGATGDWSISALSLNDSGATFSYSQSESKWTAGSNIIVAGGFEGDVTGTVSDISNHTTDDLIQGSTNLYYSDALARSAISVAGDLSYNSGTGVLSFTERTDQEVRNLFSASGDLSYDSGTGVVSFTERTDQEVRNLFSASGDLSYNSSTGEFSVSTDTGIVPNDASITISASSGLSGGGTFTTDQSFNETISVSHDNTSSESSTSNSGDTVVQNVSIDTYGHVTSIESTTISTSGSGGFDSSVQAWYYPDRSRGVEYTNTTGRPIIVAIETPGLTGDEGAQISARAPVVDVGFQSIELAHVTYGPNVSGGRSVTQSVVIPPDVTYTYAGQDFDQWAEYR